MTRLLISIISLLFVVGCATSGRLDTDITLTDQVEIPISTEARDRYVTRILGLPGADSDPWEDKINRYKTKLNSCDQTFLRTAYHERRIRPTYRDRYYKNCLRRVPDDQFEESDTPGARAELSALQTAGVVSYERNGGFRHRCQGTLVAQDIVLTAAHCFKSRMNEAGDLVEKSTHKRLERGALLFHHYDGTMRKVESYITTADAYAAKRWRWDDDHPRGGDKDYVLLRLKPQQDISPVQILKFGSGLKAGDLIFVPAFSCESPEDPTNKCSDNAERLKNKAYADISRNLCRVVFVSDSGDIIHTCQSLPGMSGGGIYRFQTNLTGKPTGEIEFVGVHQRGNGSFVAASSRVCNPNARTKERLRYCFNGGYSIEKLCEQVGALLPACSKINRDPIRENPLSG